VLQALRRHTAFVILRDDAISISQTGARVHIVGLDDRGRDWARGVPASGTIGFRLGAKRAYARRTNRISLDARPHAQSRTARHILRPWAVPQRVVYFVCQLRARGDRPANSAFHSPRNHGHRDLCCGRDRVRNGSRMSPPHRTSIDAGLCATCRHCHRVHNARGSTFYRCLRADTDARFARYPRLPVHECPGFESARPVNPSAHRR
jgi:hypothetical protein